LPLAPGRSKVAQMTPWLTFLGTILLCTAILGGAVWHTVRRVRRSIVASRSAPVDSRNPKRPQPLPVNDNDTLIAALDALVERRNPVSEQAGSGPRTSRPTSFR